MMNHPLYVGLVFTISTAVFILGAMLGTLLVPTLFSRGSGLAALPAVLAGFGLSSLAPRHYSSLIGWP